MLLAAIQPPGAVEFPLSAASAFTTEQLNARRKYEILQRRNRSVGETNPRLTKAQLWSRLNSVIVEDRIGVDRTAIPQSRRIPCFEEYYDLSVPLVGMNAPMPPPMPAMNLYEDGDIAMYTFSEITHLSQGDLAIVEDVDASVNETRVLDVGYIIVPDYPVLTKVRDPLNLSVRIVVPISLWFYYVHGGVRTTSVNGSPISYSPPSSSLDSESDPDSFARNDLRASDQVVMDVVSVRPTLTINNIAIPMPVPDIQYNLSSFVASNLTANDNNYVIQCVGTLVVNLNLPFQYNVVYGLIFEIEYSYSVPPNVFDVFQSGVLVNADVSQRLELTSNTMTTRLVPDVPTFTESSFSRIYNPVFYRNLSGPLYYGDLVLREGDAVTVFTDTATYSQTRSCDVGLITVPSKFRLATSNILFSFPIALWYYYVANTDSVQVSESDAITMTVTSVAVRITIDGSEYALASPPIIQENLQPFTATNLDQSDNGYAVQYVGMIHVANVQLQNAIDRNYRVQLLVTYSHTIPVNRFKLFQSGVYMNPPSPEAISSSSSLTFLTIGDTTPFQIGAFA